MKTRFIILLFSIPLFMTLAGLNGALLYFQERSEATAALNEQALSAAVAAAEFVSSMDDVQSVFSAPSRMQSIGAAARHIKDLDGFYFVDGEGNVSALSPASSLWTLEDLVRPSAPVVTQITLGDPTHPYIVALAPAGVDAFMAVRLDVAPMVARLAVLRRDILLIACIAGIIGAILAWHVARKIVYDLDQNHKAIAALQAGEAATEGGAFAIREARELADAVRLMGASERAAARRLELETKKQDRERTQENSAATYSRSVFAPLSQRTAGAHITARLMGDAPAGCFFTVCSDGDRAVMVVGECSAERPADALSLALAARRFLDKQLLNGEVKQWLKLAQAAFNITTLEYVEWRADGRPSPGVGLLAITDAKTRQKAARFSTADPKAAPADVLNSIDALLKPTGAFAAIRPISVAAQTSPDDGDGRKSPPTDSARRNAKRERSGIRRPQWMGQPAL